MNERAILFFFAIARSSASASVSDFASGKFTRPIRLPIETNILRNRGVDERIETFETHLAQHRANFLFVRADVSARERINIDHWFAHLHPRDYETRDALQLSSAACAAANRAIGIRNGLQLT